MLALIASNDSIYLDTYMYMSSESIKGETIGEGEADEEGTAPYSRPLTSTNQHVLKYLSALALFDLFTL